MATISIDIPNTQATRVLNGFCKAHNYQDTVPDGNGGTIPNPETKIAFAKRKIILYILDSIKTVESSAAVDAARVSAQADVDSSLTLS